MMILINHFKYRSYCLIICGHWDAFPAQTVRRTNQSGYTYYQVVYKDIGNQYPSPETSNIPNKKATDYGLRIFIPL